MSAPILFTVPKYVKLEMSNNDDSDPVDEFLIRGKKRRLDHLSFDEKIQRK